MFIKKSVFNILRGFYLLLLSWMILFLTLGNLSMVFALEASTSAALLVNENIHPIPQLHLPYNPNEGSFGITIGFDEEYNDDELTQKLGEAGSHTHAGIDVNLAEGSSVLAVDEGEVIKTETDEAYGLMLKIKHSWGESLYAHLSNIQVSAGQTIKKGDLIALSGSSGIVSGPHLHFGIRPTSLNFEKKIDGFINPLPYLEQEIPVIYSAQNGVNTKLGDQTINESTTSTTIADRSTNNQYLYRYSSDLQFETSAHFYDKSKKRAGFAITDSENKHTLRFFLKESSNSATPKIEGNIVEYPVVIEEIPMTLRYTITSGQIKEEFIINEKPKEELLRKLNDQLIITFDIENEGLKISPNKGGYDFITEDQSVYWHADAPIAFDQNGIQTSPILEIDEKSAKLKVSTEFLKTASYPIAIDPTISIEDPVSLEQNSNWVSTDYKYRKQLTITNNSESTINSGSTVAITVDTARFGSNVQTDCDDLRITYDNGSSQTEVARSYQKATGSTNCADSTATIVYFPLSASITSGSSSTSYYLYYGYASATSPSNPDNAFDVGANDATLVCPFNGTTTCAAGESPSYENGAIRYTGDKSALSFDGTNDTVSVPTNLDSTGDYTIETWVYLPKVTDVTAGGSNSGEKYFAYGSKSQGCCTHTAQLGVAYGSFNYGGFMFDVVYNNGGDAAKVQLFGNTPSANTWYHIAGVVSGNTASLYVDGVLRNSTTVNNRLTTGNWTLNGGNYCCGVSNNSSPIILDEFRASTNARYASNFTPSTAPFVRDSNTKVLYHFDENGSDPRNPDKAIDDSANLYHGTISGGRHVGGLIGVDKSTSDTGKVSSQSYAGHQGVVLEQKTINLVKNPSFEHSTYDTNWVEDSGADGADNITPTQNTTAPYYKFGSKSTKIVADADAISTTSNMFTTSINAGSTGNHTLTFYAYDGTSGNVGGAVTSSIIKPVFQGTAQTSSVTYTDMGSGWWRVKYTAAGTASNAEYGVEVPAGKTVYIDAVQLEGFGYPTSYADGSLGSGYTWASTTNDSASTRTVADLRYASSANGSQAAGAISVWVKNIGSANNFTDRTNCFACYIATIGGDNWRSSTVSLGYLNAFGFSLQGRVVSDGGTAYNITSSTTTPFALNSWVHLLFTWQSNDIRMYVNGASVGTPVTSATMPSLSSTSIFIGGSDNDGGVTNQSAGGALSDLRIFSSAVSANDVTDLYNQGLVSHSEGSDEGTYETSNYSAPNESTTQVAPLGYKADWTALDWTQTTPSGVGSDPVRFKVAAKNVDSGWSDADFIGSDCTTGTYWEDASSPYSVDLSGCSALDGKTYFRYRTYLQTEDGSVTPSVDSVTITYSYDDTASPIASLTPLSPDPNPDNTPTISGTASDTEAAITNIQYHVDAIGAPWTDCTATDGNFNSTSESFSCTVSPELSDGEHTIYIQTTDAIGNTTTSTAASYTEDTFTIDATPPEEPGSVASSDHTTSTWSSDSIVTMTWTSATDATSGIAGYSYVFDTTSNTVPDSALDIANVTTISSGVLADGNTHYFHIRAIDNTGNAGTTVHAGPYYIDTTGPTVSGTPTTTSPTPDTTPTWSWTAATDANSGLNNPTYSLRWCTDIALITDCSTTATNANSFTHSSALTDDIWYFQVTASDSLSNSSSYTTGSVIVDTLSPDAPSTPIPNNTPTNDTTPTWSWTASTDNGDAGIASYNVEWSQSSDFSSSVMTDTSETNGFTNPTALSAGTWYLRIQAVDSAGNISDYSIAESIEIETIAPTDPGTPSTENPTPDTTPTWSWTGSTDAGVGLATNSYDVAWCTNSDFTGCSLNTTTSTTNSFTHSIALTDTTWYFRVRSVDQAGNTSSWVTSSTVINSSLPTTPGTPSTTTPSQDTTPAWSWTASSDTSGLANPAYTLEWSQNSNFTAATSTTSNTNSYTHTSALTDGTWYIRVNATDNTDQDSNWSETGTVLIDTTAPTTPGTPSTTSPTSNLLPTWSWTASTDSGVGLNSPAYTVEWCMDISFTGCGSNTTTTNNTSYTHTTSLTGGAWYFRVKAIDNFNQSSAYSTGLVVISTTSEAEDYVSLQSPNAGSYTNNERPTFRWRVISPTESGVSISRFRFEIAVIDQGVIYTIDSIPASRTSDYETSHYIASYEGFNDANPDNNYISLTTKSSSFWNSSQNDGKVKNGKLNWRVIATDSNDLTNQEGSDFYVDLVKPTLLNITLQSLTQFENYLILTTQQPQITGNTIDNNFPTQLKVTFYKENYFFGLYINKTLAYQETINLENSAKLTSLDFHAISKQLIDHGKYSVEVISLDAAGNASDPVSFNIQIVSENVLKSILQQKTDEESKTKLEELKEKSEISIETLEKKAKERRAIEKEGLTQFIEIIQDWLAWLPASMINSIQETTVEALNNLFIQKAAIIATLSGYDAELLLYSQNIAKNINVFFNQSSIMIADAGSYLFAILNLPTPPNDGVLADFIQFNFEFGSQYNLTQDHLKTELSQHSLPLNNQVKDAATIFLSSTFNLTSRVNNDLGQTTNNTRETYAKFFSNFPLIANQIPQNFGKIAFSLNELSRQLIEGFPDGKFLARDIVAASCEVLCFANKSIDVALLDFRNQTSNINQQTNEKLIATFELADRTKGWLLSFESVVLDPSPTMITDVTIEEIGETHAVITWKTNDYSTGKINYGTSLGYGEEIILSRREKLHIVHLENLEPGKRYFFEVMSHGKTYTYDAYYSFETK